jgi:sensor histidine kinase regulating citrate/malate metabolism
VTISDDGEGLPEGFDPDELFDSTVSTKGDGRGMGLALCRTLIERAGGRIQIARGSGQGSRPGAVLTIGVPAAPAASRLLPGGGSEGR